MRALRLLLVLMPLAASTFVATTHAATTTSTQEPPMISPADRSGVEATLDAFDSAWNHHDMNAFAALLTDDCDWVNVVGMHWRGKAQVVKAHRAFHATMFKDVSIRTLDRQIDEIVPGVALVILTDKPDDYTTPAGHRMTNITDRMTYVLVRHGDKWLIRSAHNTTIDPSAVQHDPGK